MNGKNSIGIVICLFLAINLVFCGNAGRTDPLSAESNSIGSTSTGTQNNDSLLNNTGSTLSTQSNDPLLNNAGSASSASPSTTQNYIDPATAPVPTSPYVGGNTQAIGSDPISDGSGARLAAYGKEQYFWGDPGTGTQIPLVKIVSSTTEKVTDVALVFNPVFVDLTYGAFSAIDGWNPNRPHTLKDIYISDHVEVAFTNGAGDTVLQVKLDLLSPTNLVPTGYASLGVFGGDGALIKGDASNILSFGTSMDDNVNICGWTNADSSPLTDSAYSPNTANPCYQFRAVYRLSIDPAAFGPSGYGGALMTSVHASPAKTPQETIMVQEEPAPTFGEGEDPFQLYPTTPVADEPAPTLGGDEPAPALDSLQPSPDTLVVEGR